MISLKGLKNNKIALLLNILITIGIFMRKYFLPGESYSSAFFQSLGYSLIWIIIWFLVGGYVLLSIVHSIHNIINPSNEVQFSHLDRLNFGIFTGWIVRLFW